MPARVPAPDEVLLRCMDDLLRAAANNKIKEAQKILEERPAAIHAVDKDNGMTPLHFAAANGSLEMARLFMRYNASAMAEEYRGRVPGQLAIGTANDVLIAELDRYTFPHDFQDHDLFEDNNNAVVPLRPKGPKAR